MLSRLNKWRGKSLLRYKGQWTWAVRRGHPHGGLAYLCRSKSSLSTNKNSRMQCVFDIDGSWGILYATIRDIDICEIIANWLSKICKCWESTTTATSHWLEHCASFCKRRDDAGLNICVLGFWRRQQCAFFDVRVFHPNARNYCSSSISSLFRRHEQATRKEYGDWIREIKKGSFTRLVFVITGGVGQEATQF